MEEALGSTIRFIGYVVFELFLYSTARFVLPLISFGRLRAAPLGGPWFLTPLIRREPDGTRLVSPELSVAIGLLVWSIVGVAVLAAL